MASTTVPMGHSGQFAENCWASLYMFYHHHLRHRLSKSCCLSSVVCLAHGGTQAAQGALAQQLGVCASAWDPQSAEHSRRSQKVGLAEQLSWPADHPLVKFLFQ